MLINEIDSALSMDDLKTCESVTEPLIPDFEILETKITSALKKILTTFDSMEKIYVNKYL